jgi:hypothetical protein
VVEGSVLERSWSPERSPGLSRSPDLKVSLFTDHTAYDTLPNRDVGRTRHSALCRDVPREDAHDDAGAMSVIASSNAAVAGQPETPRSAVCGGCDQPGIMRGQ